jgi:metal-responsive CopG/Arc/MetJ family transcriptional regulator
MYDGVMHRTQVLLGSEEIASLDEARRQTGASRGELIRRAVRAVYGRADEQSKSSARGRFATLGGGVWSEELVAERRAEAAGEK